MIRASHKEQLRRDAEHVAQLERRASHDDGTGLALRASQHFVQHLPRQRAVPLYLATQFPARYAVLVRVLDEARLTGAARCVCVASDARRRLLCAHVGGAVGVRPRIWCAPPA